MHKDEPLLNTSDAAAILGITRRAVIDLIRTRVLPAQKLSGTTGSYILKRPDVEALRDQRKKSAEEAASA